MSTFVHRARFRLDHRWAPDRMSDYVDGELSAARSRRMERHVDGCSECRRALAALRSMLDALHALPPLSDGSDAARIAAAIRPRL